MQSIDVCFIQLCLFFITFIHRHRVDVISEITAYLSMITIKHNGVMYCLLYPLIVSLTLSFVLSCFCAAC